MASLPFARGLLLMEEDTEANHGPKDKEIVKRDSSGYETYINASKSRRRPLESTTSSSETSSRARSAPRSSRNIRVPKIHSPAPPKRKEKYGGSFDEKTPLLGNTGSRHAVVDVPQQEEKRSKCLLMMLRIIQLFRRLFKYLIPSAAERFCSIIVFLILFITGIVLIISANIKSDNRAKDIDPAVFHYYTVGLISVFILWLTFEYYRRFNNDDRNQDFDPLIPRHLLNGLALFGVCNSAFQVLEVVDFIKCSRTVSGLDKSYVVSASIEIIFVYCQLFLFYTLSHRRKQKIWFGNYFAMFTLAVNCTLWAGYFCAGAANNRDLKNETWIQHYHYGSKEDLCANINNTGNQSRLLHQFVNSAMPFKFTFAMEYSLLSSALLLHVWLELKSSATCAFAATNKTWEVWRFGFIAGLFCLPLMGCICVHSTVEINLLGHNVPILYSGQLVFLLLVLFCSIGGLRLLIKHFKFETKAKAAKLDIILLCVSSLGFLVFDLFSVYAWGDLIFGEGTYNNTSAYLSKLMSGVQSLVELATVCSLTLFIFASYFYKATVSVDGVKAAKKLRQIASFCIIVSFGFWAMRTYVFRSKHNFIALGYFSNIKWFVIDQCTSFMRIFYHFHCSVCLSWIIANWTVATERGIS